MSDSEKVADFTSASGFTVPNKPSSMSKDEVFFLSKMMLDEILELCSTVADSNESKLNLITSIINSKNLPQIHYAKDSLLIADQADALIDCYYYSLNAACKKGINLSKIFDIVHESNMNKRDPITLKFIKRDDGKIIKPDGWEPPNIVKEIERQDLHGSFY